MKTTPAKAPSNAGIDAITLLTQDHKAVQKIFKEFDKLKQNGGSDDEKSELGTRACQELTVHAQIEEEIFYPAVRAAIEDQDLMDEAEVEHGTAKELIAQLESMEPGDDMYDARFTVLSEYIKHHVKEEQDEMFPKARKAKLDLKQLGEEMLLRKQELRAELGMEESDDSEDDAESRPRAARVARAAGSR
jgi:hemerythrin-like domain-containing protein